MSDTGNRQTVVELDTLADQAAAWFQRLSDENVPTEVAEAFDRWIAASPAHKAAYQEYASIWYHPDFDTVLEEFNCEEDIQADNREDQPQGFARWVRWQVVAVLAVALVLMPFFFSGDKGAPVPRQVALYQTQVGEIRSIELPDGTRVDLNTDTKMKISFGEARRVTLLQGEAFFNVAKDGRQFVVTGGTGQVTVLGTAFNARVKYNQIVVSVDHGRVAVGSRDGRSRVRTLTDNDTLAVTDNRLGSVRSSDHQIADWRDGWLEITDTSLLEVVRELDRYHPGEIRLADPELWRLRVTGRFDLTDIDRAVKVLARSLQITVSVTSDNEIVISKN